jgi:hypothetical protein
MASLTPIFRLQNCHFQTLQNCHFTGLPAAFFPAPGLIPHRRLAQRTFRTFVTIPTPDCNTRPAFFPWLEGRRFHI